jgi:chromate transporter
MTSGKDPSPPPPHSSAAAAAPPAPLPPPPTVAQLFATFAAISLSGFGGVLAWARRILVERRRWLSAEQFNETFALCAFLPGGNIVNFCVIFGARMRGPLGALAALGGLLGPPVILVMIVGALYAHYGDMPVLHRMLTGVAAAAAGLMLATVAKMTRPLFANSAVAAPAIAFATFAAIGLLHWPLPYVLLVIVPGSIAAAALPRLLPRVLQRLVR